MNYETTPSYRNVYIQAEKYKQPVNKGADSSMKFTPKVIDIDLSFPKESFSIEVLTRNKDKFGFEDIKKRPDALIFSNKGTNIVIYVDEIRARSIDPVDSVIPLVERVINNISEIFEFKKSEEPIEMDIDAIFEIKSVTPPHDFFMKLMKKETMETLVRKFPKILPAIRLFLQGTNTKQNMSVRIEPLVKDPTKFFVHVNFYDKENIGPPDLQKIFINITDTYQRIMKMLDKEVFKGVK